MTSIKGILLALSAYLTICTLLWTGAGLGAK